jgi:hypothetical protein
VPDVDLSGEFAAQLAELNSAEQINDFLATLLMLVVQNRISVPRAAVLAYITNQLLRTVSIMNKEGKENPHIICGMPRPERDGEPLAEHSYAGCAPDQGGIALWALRPAQYSDASALTLGLARRSVNYGKTTWTCLKKS